MADGVEAGRSLGRYVIESPIGAGGFATVFRARDTGLDRPVALKVLDPLAQRNPTTARRFVNEGRAAASLDHPAIVPVYDAGETDGLSWLAMRLVPGESLAEAILRDRRFDDAEIDALLGRIGPALDHAHAQGVVHRDVKPSNILLEGGDPARAWLADFGIAATARTAGLYTTGTLGTAAYMAPEQARPSEVGPPADVYSLGCVAYELVVGRRPFPGDDHVALLMAHTTSPVPPTGDVALDRALGRALAKAPGDRPPSGAALAFEVRHALASAAAPGPRTVPEIPATAPGGAPTLVATAPGPRLSPRPPPPPPAPIRPVPAQTTPHPPTVAYAHAPPTPTPARRGRGAARFMVLAGVVVLVAVAAVVAYTLIEGDDGTRQCDDADAGVCFTLPAGWSVGEVGPGEVTLVADGQVVAGYTHRAAEDGENPVDALAGSDQCATEARAAPVGDADGARCETADGRTAALVVDGGTLWMVTVAAEVPADEADDFLASFAFG